MREIKFRAWHIKIGEMANVDTIHFNGYVHLSPISKISDESKMFRFDEVELMQYTGLKDKNGKEIYEGDIVKYAVGYNKQARNIAKIEWTPGWGYTGIRVDCYVLEHMNNVEVIGNIHEHKHLLSNPTKDEN